MTHKITLTATSIVLSTLLLTGCGGGSSSGSDNETKEVTGQFIDTYVEGLNYTCSSGAEGVTNSEGEYTCNEGDTVEFSLGEYVLGSATASSGIVTPVTLYPEDADAALNVAQLLQTLDSDSDDGIITIPEDFSDLDDVAVTPEDDAFDETMEEKLDEPLVSETDAQEHMDEAFSSNLTALLSGKTLYHVEKGDFYLDRLVINEDATSISWTVLISSEDDPAGTTGTASIKIEEDKIIFPDEEGEFLQFVEVTEDYILWRGEGDAGEERSYFSEEKARAYLDSFSSVIPVKTISSSADWDDVAVIHTDAPDGIEMSGLDIKQIKMAEDNNNLYLQFERAGLDFPSSSKYYYNYWVYFNAGDATFSIENFHDDAGNLYYRVYRGIGYDGGVQVHETVSSANVSSVNLEMVVPKSLNVIDPTATYHVTMFTHGFLKDNSTPADILGEAEDDAFEVKFNTDISTPDTPSTDTPSTDTPALVGSWYMGDASESDNIVTLTFFENGSYVMLQDGNTPDGYDGMERGTYSWDATSGVFSATALTDTNGEWGLSHSSINIMIDNNTLTMTEGADTYTATRVENIANSIVGSWYMGDASEADNIVNLTFFSNGSYVMLQDGSGSYGNDGMERGTYSWDATSGVFSATALTDTNGEWGLSDSTINITIDNNTLTMVEGEDTYTATKIE